MANIPEPGVSLSSTVYKSPEVNGRFVSQGATPSRSPEVGGRVPIVGPDTSVVMFKIRRNDDWVDITI